MPTSEELLSAITDLNFWGKSQKTGISREKYLEEAKRRLRAEDAIVLLGVRRAGKTFLSKQLLALMKPEHTLYVNFEDHKLEPFLSLPLLDQLYDAYRETINPQEFAYLVFDEIQAVPKWEKWVRGMLERQENIKLIVTGSNARLLKKEISTLLTGRTLSLEIFPLSFREFLSFKGILLQKEKDFIIQEKKIKSSLKEFLRYGGFPKVVLEPDAEVKLQHLRELFEGIVYRDIIVRNKIREEHTAKVAAELALANFSCQLSANKLRNLLMNLSRTIISPNFVVKLLQFFEDAFLVFQVPIFSYKVKEQKQHSRKIYAIDTGLINAVTTKFRDDFGLVYENVVALELFRRYRKENIFYWKNVQQEEVDFLVKEGHAVKHVIQVCYQMEVPETKKREIKALLKALEEFKLKKGIIITSEEEWKENKDGKEITAIPLRKFLLTDLEES